MEEGPVLQEKTDREVGRTFFNIDIFCNNILKIAVHA